MADPSLTSTGSNSGATGQTGTGSYGVNYQGLGPTGGDPFSYTNDSLLTPWTQQFHAPESSQGGPAMVNMDPFAYKDFGYNWDPYKEYTGQQDYQARPDLQYGSYDPAGQFGYSQGVPQFDPNAGPQLPGEFQWGSRGPTYLSQGPIGGMQPPPNWAGGGTGPTPGGGPGGGQDQQGYLGQPNEFQGVDAFKAPTITDDPSFKFRTQEGLNALQNTALGRGVRGGDVQQALQNYGQQAGSQEYAAAWQRAMGQQQNAYQQAANTYGMNANTQLQYNQNAFNQAMGAQGINLQRYGQGQAAQSQNFQNQLAAQGQGYNQAANTFGMNEANRQAAYGLNWQTQSGLWDRNTQQAMQTNQMNNQSRLDAYRANVENALGGGKLGYEIAGGTYDRNRQNAMDQWQSAYNIASQNASASNAARNQEYGRAMNEYQMAYGIFNQNQENQYNRLMGMAGLGMNANAQAGAAGQNYANMYGQNAQGGANAYGAGQMAGANAWGNALGAAGGAAAQYMGMTQFNPYGNRGGYTGGGGYQPGGFPTQWYNP